MTPLPRAALVPLQFALFAVTLSAAVACSDDPEGNGATGAKAGCTGAFCLEDDTRIDTVPLKLLFADLPAGAQQEVPLKIRAGGKKGAIVVSALSLTGGDGKDNPALTGQFEILGFKPATLQPGDTLDVVVRYTVAEAGAKQATLLVHNDGTKADDRKHPVPIQVAGGGSALLILPSPVDFGNVPANEKTEKSVQLVNAGAAPVTLGAIELSPSGSADFGLGALPDLKTPILAGASATVVVRYTPTGGDFDETTLVVETADGKKQAVAVTGNEIAPNLSVTPPKLLFGDMKKGDKKTLPLKVSNTGLSDLTVSQLVLHDKSAIKTVLISPQAPFTLEAQKDKLLQVELTATEALKGGIPVASLVVHSNDPGDPQVIVPMYGESATPIIRVSPNGAPCDGTAPCELDFAFVGKGLKVKRKVELYNDGKGVLSITKLDLKTNTTGEYAIVGGLNFPVQLEASKGVEFEVQFTSTGKPGEKVKGLLEIHSNDGAKPVFGIDLYAERADGTACAVKMEPTPVNFGITGYGTVKELKVTLKNVGTGFCSFDSVTVLDCTTLPSLLPIPVSPACKGVPSPYFKALNPSAKLFNLGPGEIGSIPVQFSAPEDLGLFGGGKPNAVSGFHALFVARFKDVATGAVKNYPDIDIAVPAKVTAVKLAEMNLLAKVGLSAVQVLPGDIDFGVITVGCWSKPETISVYNNGSTDVFITKVELVGCGPEVDFVNKPAIPKTGLQVAQSGGSTSKPVNFVVQYGPQNVGKDQCQVNVYTGVEGTCADAQGNAVGKACQTSAECTVAGQWCKGEQFTVPLIGVGTLDDEFTDVFEQGSGKKVDVLFVIDDSGSMSEEQKNLSNNFKDFLVIADIWKNEYHLGVVSTDMEAGGKSGKLQEKNGARIVTPKTPNPTGTFQGIANLGSNGSGDEQGLAAAFAALTAPLITDTKVTCKTDKDCSAPSTCVKNADDGTLACGGFNRTFMRKNAGLEVVILSDEEDSSPADVSFYVNAFQALKGPANKNLFHFHSIVGPKGNCSGAGGQAAAGNRYLAVSAATGGKTASICDTTFAQVLKDIGQVAFGLAAQFFLTRDPVPSTIAVTVAGKPCPGGAKAWSYDEPSNSVIFVEKDKGGTCHPQQGDKVTIYYKMLCGSKG